MSSAVLIADGNRTRARRLGEACVARGFATSFASQGAEALEMALADVPDVVVAPVDLPLIDAARLAEILRANPRTQDARFLFLGRSGAEARAGVFDEVLPPQSSADEVALRVEAMLAQRARYGLFPSEGDVIATGPHFVTADDAAQAIELSRQSIR